MKRMSAIRAGQRPVEAPLEVGHAGAAQQRQAERGQEPAVHRQLDTAETGEFGRQVEQAGAGAERIQYERQAQRQGEPQGPGVAGAQSASGTSRMLAYR